MASLFIGESVMLVLRKCIWIIKMKEFKLYILTNTDREIELTYRGNENIIIEESPGTSISRKILVPRNVLEKFIEMIGE